MALGTDGAGRPLHWDPRAELDDVRQAGWVYLGCRAHQHGLLMALFIPLGRSAGTTDFDGFTGCDSGWPAGWRMSCLSWRAGLRRKGRFPDLARLAAGSASGRAEPRVGAHVGRDDQDGHLRLVRLAHLPVRSAAAVVGWLLSPWDSAPGGRCTFGAAQHDLKRPVGLYSVENIGIILLGPWSWLPGFDRRGRSWRRWVSRVDYWHVLESCALQGLAFFLGAGAVLHTTGLPQHGSPGRLTAPMRWTGLAFTLAPSAISRLAAVQRVCQ